MKALRIRSLPVYFRARHRTSMKKQFRAERRQCAIGSYETIELLSAGIAVIERPAVQRRHFDDLYTFEYVLAGSGTVALGNEVHSVRAHDVYILPRDATHTLTATDCPWTKIWFCLRGRLVDALVDLYALRGVHRIGAFRRPAIFSSIRDIAAKPPDDAAEKMSLAFHSFCIQAERICRTKRRYSHEIGTVIRYLEAHIGDELSLEKIAALASLSSSQMTRRFRAETGTTPHHYIICRKIDRAKILLSTTNAGLSEIARTLAFTDQYHFSNTFKKHAGMPPERYRDR
ncbi:MAG: AraC family transcriptional regulator [Spirochaetota bacterium]